MTRLRQQAPPGAKPRHPIPLPLLAAAVALAIALVVALFALLAQPRGCPAGSFDGYRASGCYRSYPHRT